MGRLPGKKQVAAAIIAGVLGFIVSLLLLGVALGLFFIAYSLVYQNELMAYDADLFLISPMGRVLVDVVRMVSVLLGIGVAYFAYRKFSGTKPKKHLA